MSTIYWGLAGGICTAICLCWLVVRNGTSCSAEHCISFAVAILNCFILWLRMARVNVRYFTSDTNATSFYYYLGTCTSISTVHLILLVLLLNYVILTITIILLNYVNLFLFYFRCFFIVLKLVCEMKLHVSLEKNGTGRWNSVWSLRLPGVLFFRDFV